MTPAIKSTATGLTAAGYKKPKTNWSRHAVVPKSQQPGRLGETTLPSQKTAAYFFSRESGYSSALSRMATDSSICSGVMISGGARKM